MSWITDLVINLIKPKKEQNNKNIGPIILKPSESKQAKKITKKTGIKTIVAKNENVGTSYTKSSSGKIKKHLNVAIGNTNKNYTSIKKHLYKNSTPTVSIGKKVTSLPLKTQLNIQKKTKLSNEELKRSRIIKRNGKTFLETSPENITYFSKKVGELNGTPILNYYKIKSKDINKLGILNNDLSTLKTAKKISGKELKELLKTQNVLKAVTNQETIKRINELRDKAMNKFGSIKNPLYMSEYERAIAKELSRKKNKSNLEKTQIKILKSHATFLNELTNNIIGMPFGVYKAIKNPKYLLSIPKNIIKDTKKTINLMSTSPEEGIAKIGADYLTFKITDEGLKFTGKVASKLKTRINPYFKKFEGNILKIKVPEESWIRRGKTIYLKKRIKNTNIINKLKTQLNKKLGTKLKVKKAGQFYKFQKEPGYTLKKGLLVDVSKPLSEQVKLAGKERIMVTSQANKLLGLLKRKKLIRKPIPGEEGLSLITKKLLKKFDKGKITKKEFYKLNQRVLKETGKTMLERNLFADPNSLIRFTRLGKNIKEATLKDYLTGDVTIKKLKPQILVFKEKVAEFPNKIKPIINKLKKGKTITESERAKLTEWATNSKDKFTEWKAPGDVRYKGGIESEVTLQAGNIIKRTKKLAQTEINGIPVEIVEAKTIKLKKETNNLLKKAEKGNLNDKEVSKLQKSLKEEAKIKLSKKSIKELGKRIIKDYERIGNKKIIPVKRLITGKILKSVRKRKLNVSKRKKIVAKKIITRKIKSKKIVPRKITTKRKIKNRIIKNPRKIIKSNQITKKRFKTPTIRRKIIKNKIINKRILNKKRINKKLINKRIIKRRPTSPKTIKKVIKKPKAKTIKKRLQKKRKIIKAYNVYVKEKGRYIKVNKYPLSKINALNRGAYIVNRSTSATMKVIPAKKVKKLGSITNREIGEFNKIRKNIRNYRIIKGKKKKVKGLYIEKRGKPRINTKGEKKRLKAAALLKRLQKTKKRKVKGGKRK